MPDILIKFSGALVNTLTVLLGSSVGLLLKKQIPEKFTNAIMTTIGLCTIAIGIGGIIKGENQLVMVLSLVLGVIVGTLLNIDGKLTSLGDRLQKNAKKSDSEKAKFSQGFVTASLLFCMGAMTIVEVVDQHGGFNWVRGALRSKTKRGLLWKIAFMTAILSAVLDNLTTSIVMILLLHKLINDVKDRMWYASCVVIAANAGGAFSPIGDVTTIMLWNGKMITPRGYYRERSEDACGLGQDIMMRSFRTIESELKDADISLDRKWVLLHTIHTTADFDMERLLVADEGAAGRMFEALNSGRVRTIVTDVTMAASGIRKGALERMGLQVKCYLSDERVAAMAKELGITRTQAGIRLAVEEHPDAVFVFGNAPTALMELCTLVRKGKAHPCGVVAAPVGFVNVCESKHMLKPLNVDKIIVEGRKGGSNLAATIVNAVLCYDDAQQLKPGRDV